MNPCDQVSIGSAWKMHVPIGHLWMEFAKWLPLLLQIRGNPYYYKTGHNRWTNFDKSVINCLTEHFKRLEIKEIRKSIHMKIMRFWNIDLCKNARNSPHSRYGISLRIQSECGKIRNRNTLNREIFHVVPSTHIFRDVFGILSNT